MAFGLGASGHLEHLLHEYVVSDVRQSLLQLDVQRSLEVSLRHSLTRRIGLVHDLYPGVAEEVLWMRIEEHQSDIERLDVLIRAAYDPQALSKFQRRHVLRSRIKVAADLAKVVNHEVRLEIGDFRLHVRTVVKRDIPGKLEQFLHRSA